MHLLQSIGGHVIGFRSLPNPLEMWTAEIVTAVGGENTPPVSFVGIRLVCSRSYGDVDGRDIGGRWWICVMLLRNVNVLIGGNFAGVPLKETVYITAY
ncbi:hypothetical protein R6Q59_007550 [Mikania micrantha]